VFQRGKPGSNILFRNPPFLIQTFINLNIFYILTKPDKYGIKFNDLKQKNRNG